MKSRWTSVLERAVSVLAWISGMCAFVPVCLMVLLASLVAPVKRFDPLTKLGCRLIMRFLFVGVKVEGLANFRKAGTYLFVANHVNIFDVFVLYGHIPNYFRGIELDEHFDWFFYGPVIRRLGMIPVSQTNPNSALGSLKRALRVIRRGTSLLILPEGGRTLDGDLQPFKNGAFILAKKAGVDIVPTVMIGAFHIKRKGSLLIRPGKMTLRFGPAIAYADIKDLTVEQLAALVRGRMLALSGS